jgi:hypothetical protein
MEWMQPCMLHIRYHMHKAEENNYFAVQIGAMLVKAAVTGVPFMNTISIPLLKAFSWRFEMLNGEFP